MQRGKITKKKAVRKKVSKKNTGVSLEKTVARIQQMMDPESKVTYNEKLVDRVGNTRQYDVVIRERFGGREVLVHYQAAFSEIDRCASCEHS